MKRASGTIASSVRGITRRSVLTTSAAVFAAPAIIGRAHAAGDYEDELVFACDGGATQRVFEKEFFPEFQKMTGAKVTYLPGQSADTLARLRNSKTNPIVDVAWFSGGAAFSAMDEGLAMELDHARVPNMAHVDPAAGQEPKGTPVGIAISGLLHNTDIFKKNNFPKPTSWFDIWDSRYKGHVGFNEISATITPLLIVTIAQILTGDYKNLDAAFAKFKEIRPNVLNYYPSAGAMEDAMQQGDLWLCNKNASRALQLVKSGAPMEFLAKPKETGSGYQTWLTIPQGAPHPKAAHAWVNYLLSDDSQLKIAKLLGFVPVVPNITLPDDIKPYFLSVKEIFMPDWRYMSKTLPRMVERWNREIER